MSAAAFAFTAHADIRTLAAAIHLSIASYPITRTDLAVAIRMSALLIDH